MVAYRMQKKLTLQLDKAGGQNLLSHTTTDLGLYCPYIQTRGKPHAWGKNPNDHK